MHSEFLTLPNNSAEEKTQSLIGFFAKLAQNKKSITLIVSIVFGLSLLLGSFSFWGSPVLFFFQLAGFFALGYAHASTIGTTAEAFSATEKIFFSFLLSVVVLLALSLLTILKTNRSWLSVAACACAFAWPAIVAEAQILFGQMSATPAPVWRYDAALPAQKSTTFLNSIPVRFRIETESSLTDSQTVSFRAPVRMQLGTIFYHTVQEQNEKGNAVRLLNLDDQPYEWTFSVRSLGSSRYLQPELGLIENRIKPNALIVVRRLER